MRHQFIILPPPPPRRTSTNLFGFGVFVFLAMLPSFLFAQLFTEIQLNQMQWPTDGYTRYLSIQDSSFSKSVKIVSMLDVRYVQSEGTLSFQLPGNSEVYQAEASLITDDTSNGFLWSGKLTNTSGYVAFVHRNGLTAGFIQVGSEFYEISPIDSNYQFLVKRNNDYSPSAECGVPLSPPPGPNTCDYSLNYNTCPALITVLLILTPEAKLIVEEKYGSADIFALLGQMSVNFAFWNSDIPNKEIRVKWVVKPGFSFSSDPGQPYLDDLANLKNFSEPERTQNNADLVVLIPHVDYAQIGGLANIAVTPDPDQAFSIVEIEPYLGIYAFAHEIGHNLGCRHNWPFDLGNDQTKVCAHGKRWLPINTITQDWFQELDSWRTIMAVPLNPNEVFEYEIDGNTIFIQIVNNENILHYSNPSVSYNGEPTGRATEPIADNANLIRSVGCEINNYNTSNELSLNLSHSPCPGPLTFTATITPPSSGFPGVGPYTVFWYWNKSGVFGTGNLQLLGTGTTLTVNEYPACPVFWVKCIIISADNVVVSKILKVILSPCECIALDDERPGKSRNSDDLRTTKALSTIFPNPVVHGFTFVQSASTLHDNNLTYSISDVCGREILTGEATLIGENQYRLPLENLSDGLYLATLILPQGKYENHKIIIKNAH